MNGHHQSDQQRIDNLVRLDEHLATNDTHGGGTGDTEGRESLGALASCLELIHRVRRVGEPSASRELPATSNLEWLYQEETLPDKIGRFQIRERLGAGGFGLVFLAQDPELDREVALKLPRLQTLIGTASRERFLRESRLAASLAHENIAAVYEAGSIGPLNYIATAYCSGGSILDLLNRNQGRLPPHTAALFVAQLAEAVQHAHSRGILHRDIKPANIMLDADDAELPSLAGDPKQLATRLRLVDFGLARDLQQAESGTRTGAMIGTPSYMAPEQAAGDGGKISEAVDIYALGATLYRLLTGRPPFAKSSDVETAMAVQTDEPIPAHRLQAGIPRDLDAICLKCLEKEPTRRYPSASALQADLHRFLGGQPTEARPLGRLGRLGRWSWRNPALATALAALLVVLTTGATVSTALWMRSERLRQQADKQAVEALRQAQHARQAVDSLLASIAREPSLRSESMEKFRQQLFAAAATYYASLKDEHPEDPEIVNEYVATLSGLSRMHTMLGDYEQAAEISERAVELARDVADSQPGLIVELLTSRADDLMSLNRFDEAITTTQEALTLAETSTEFGDSKELQQTLIKTLVATAQAFAYNGQPARAKAYVDRAVTWGTTFSGKPPALWPANVQLARALRCKTEIAMMLGQADNIKQYGEWGLRILADLQRTDPTRVSMCLESSATLHKALGARQRMLGNHAALATEIQQERQLVEQLIDRHPDVVGLKARMANLEFRLSRALERLDRDDEALAQIAASLDWIETFKQQVPHPQQLLEGSEIHFWQLRGLIHRKLKNWAEARDALQSALVLCEGICQAEEAPLHVRADLGLLHSDLATVYHKQHELDLAHDHFQRSVETLADVVAGSANPEPHAFLASALFHFAELEHELEDFQAALQLIDQLLSHAPSDARRDTVRRRRVLLLVHTGQFDEAVTAYQDLIAAGANATDVLEVIRCGSLAVRATTELGTDRATACGDRLMALVVPLWRSTRSLHTGSYAADVSSSEDFAPLRAATAN